MSAHQEVTFTLNIGYRKRNKAAAQAKPNRDTGIPRIARLMALAIRLEGLVREETLVDYADIAQRGQVTRARVTQIMKLLNLAPDIQEQILFLPLAHGLNERKLRPVTAEIDWDKQRRLFQGDRRCFVCELTASIRRAAYCIMPGMKTPLGRIPNSRAIIYPSASLT